LHLLAPLDGLLTSDDLADFLPRLIELARIDGALYALPRNVDVRLLHYRTDIVDRPPATWDELVEKARRANSPPETYGFVFPGMDSGLFGTFYELCEAGGASLFPANRIPDIQNEGGRWALSLLRTCYRDGLVPPAITEWHYDRVHDCFRARGAALVGDWPGYYGDYVANDSPVRNDFALALYPVGPSGESHVYGGSHTFALTQAGAAKPEALALLRFLTAPEQQELEAQRGSVPVRGSLMESIRATAQPVEAERLHLLEQAIASVVIPPKLARYPEIEEILWRTVQAAMVGNLEVDAALAQMTQQIGAIMRTARARAEDGRP
jgi:multiple sugar transport system substrate-binding protein